MHILIVVTHLLGTGHLRRAINLSHAFVTEGHKVTLASGGMQVDSLNTEGISFIQLPPLRSDGTNFTRLLGADDAIVDESYLQSRGDKLIELLQKFQFDAIITELFPFGRRVLREEFTRLLKAAHARPVAPVMLSSVRDILAAPSSDKKVEQTEALIDSYYDGVFVHSDRATTPLDVSWPVSDLLQAKLYYTGYVAARSAGDIKEAPQHTGEVIVSAGGGSVGRQLYETAIEAARLSPNKRWRLLIGGSDAREEVARLKILAYGSSAPNSSAQGLSAMGSSAMESSGTDLSVIIEPNRPDFMQLLSGAACSVSMCGYNTAIDLLLTGTPGVLIPFDAGGEQEQTLRARSLSNSASYNLLLSEHLTPESLCSAVDKSIATGRFSTDSSMYNGALETVRLTTTLVSNKRENRVAGQLTRE